MMRIAALRSMLRANINITPFAKKLASDSSPAVRREIALSLRNVEWESKAPIVQTLFKGFDGWDPWYLEALGTAVEGEEAEAYELLVGSIAVDPINWDRPIAEIAWRLHVPAAISGFAQRAMSSELSTADRKRMINGLAFVKERKAAESMLRIATEGPEDMRGLAAWWGHNRDKNDWQTYAMGSQFPTPPIVAKNKPGEGAPKLMFDPAGKSLAHVQVNGTDQGEMIDVDITGANRLYLIVDQPAKDKKKNTPLTDWINPVLVGPEGETDVTKMSWMSATRVGKADVPRIGRNAKRDRLKVAGHQKPKGIGVKPRSVIAYDIEGKGFTRFKAFVAIDEASVGSTSPARFTVKIDRSPLAKTVSDVKTIIETKGSASHGKALFFSKKLNCANCHLVSGYGGQIGPDLTKIATKHARPLLFEAILKPSAAIATGFETISILTVDGQVTNGLLISNGNPVVIKDANGKLHTFDKDDIELQKSGEVSVMPEMKELLTVQETADLVAYLQVVSTGGTADE